jgi:hypothetical protein
VYISIISKEGLLVDVIIVITPASETLFSAALYGHRFEPSTVIPFWMVLCSLAGR